MEPSTKSLPVVFITQTPYPLPSQKFMIPATWRRYQLSQLINKALNLPKPVPFDFILKGEILRNALGGWCAENGVGEEVTLEIEYIEAVMPPEKMSDFPHEDWVSSVSCRIQGQFFTASYDGYIRSFNYSKATTSTTLAHTAAITSICFVPSINSASPDTHIIASASHDLTGQLTEITTNSTTKPKPLAKLHLHTAPLTSVDSNTTGSHIITASWDGLIGLWDSSIPTSHEVPDEQERKKRRRVEEGTRVKRKAPQAVLKSHTARVSRALFGQSTTAYSCGFDSTIRVWDTDLGVCTQTITASEKPFLDLGVSDDGRTVLATSTDRTMTLYDTRVDSSLPTTTTAAASFAHPATPSCLILGTPGSHQVVSGAYDGVVRLWDLRSVKGNEAMAGFKAWDGTKKVLSVDWARGVVGVGGEGGFEVWRVGEERR